MGLVFQVSASCGSVGGIAKVSGNFEADTTYHYALSRTGDPSYSLSGNFAADQPLELPGLANGAYVLALQNEQDSAVFGQRTFAISCATSPLALDYAGATAATPTAGGTLTVRASGGITPLYAALAGVGTVRQQLLPNAQGKLETNFPNLPAGTYNGAVADSSYPQQSVSFSVTVTDYVKPTVRGCTDPSATNYNPDATQDDGSCQFAPVVRIPHFEVPALQSLRFVKPGATDRPAFDNTLLADEKPLDFTVAPYCQKVEQGDTLVLQIQSNYQGAPVVRVQNSAGTVVLSVPAVRVMQGAGQTQAFTAYFKPDPTPGRVRVYFNDDALPLPFLPGQRVTVSGTGTSLDGTYPLHDVLEDAAAAVPYLVVTATYGSGSLRLDGTLTTTYQLQQYDTYQAVLSFASVPRGCYQARVSASDSDFGTGLVVSEPLDVEPTHPGTLLIAYRNFDNTWDLNYSAGLVNRQRVSGRFFVPQPEAERTVLRNDDDTLQLLTASVYRKVQLETLLLPGYLHETLFYAFSHDFVKVQGVRVVLDGDYAYTPVERYTLGKGAALLELQATRGAGNRDDLGDTDVDTGGPYLIANNSYLLARP